MPGFFPTAFGFVTDEHTWLIIGAICGIAVGAVCIIVRTSRQIDTALERAFKT